MSDWATIGEECRFFEAKDEDGCKVRFSFYPDEGTLRVEMAGAAIDLCAEDALNALKRLVGQED